ncbi:MAG: hypothetical protein MUC94_16170 [bacterium]|jgi:hypothetical protein|nr:hypothetical protein [bacterium]
MTPNQLIKIVRQEKKSNWKNSDFPEQWEQNIEKISNHMAQCQSCATDFGNFARNKKTLQDVFNSHHQPENLEDWICS